MLIITVTCSIIMIIVSLLVLLALWIKNDDSESTTLMRKAIRVNALALFIVFSTYSMAAYDYYISPGATTASGLSAFDVSLIFSDLANLTFAPICIYLVNYISALTGYKDHVEKCTRVGRPILVACGLGLIGTTIIPSVAWLMGCWPSEYDSLVYSIEIALVALALSCVLGAALAANRYLGAIRVSCFVLYIIAGIASLVYLWFSNESVFFALGAGMLAFLLIAMQTERVNMSNVASVRRALNRSEALDAQLGVTRESLEKEKFLLAEIADVYNSLHLINLGKGTFRELKIAPERAQRIIDSIDTTNLQPVIWAVMERVCNAKCLCEARTFTDFSTLNERMKGLKVVSLDVINDEGRWTRLSFIRIGGDLDDDLAEIVFASENIDHYMKERERLEHVSYHDSLTGALNRNAYSEFRRKNENVELSENLWVMALDINGLKTTNDTLGHEAGDELICGTAQCLHEAFGELGDIYRNGGDEFVIVVKSCEQGFYAMLADLYARSRAWRGSYLEHLMFSVGYVCASGYPGLTFSELAKVADKRMYEDKREFYTRHKELDRRANRLVGA